VDIYNIEVEECKSSEVLQGLRGEETVCMKVNIVRKYVGREEVQLGMQVREVEEQLILRLPFRMPGWL